MKNIRILILVSLCSTSCKKNFQDEFQNYYNLNIKWEYSFAVGCSTEEVFYANPRFSHVLEVENQSDSTFFFYDWVSEFWSEKEKTNLFGSLVVIEPGEKRIIELYEPMPRTSNYYCDTTIFRKIRKMKFLVHRRNPSFSVQDSIRYLSAFRKSRTKNTTSFILPQSFIVKKSEDFKLYPNGVYPPNIELPEPGILLDLDQEGKE